MSITEFRNRI